MEEQADSVTTWVLMVADGDERAAAMIWHRYFERLLQIAMRRRVAGSHEDEEDAVLSALNSFYDGARANAFPNLHDRDGLWALLVTMTQRKMNRQLERFDTEKRGKGKVRAQSAIGREDAPGPLDRIPSKEASPEALMMMQEFVQQLRDLLGNESTNKVLSLRLCDKTYREIADEMVISQKTVERKMVLIRNACARLLDDDQSSPVRA